MARIGVRYGLGTIHGRITHVYISIGPPSSFLGIKYHYFRSYPQQHLVARIQKIARPSRPPEGTDSFKTPSPFPARHGARPRHAANSLKGPTIATTRQIDSNMAARHPRAVFKLLQEIPLNDGPDNRDCRTLLATAAEVINHFAL
jgi:hypothetical protein